jgi:nitrate/nitrite transporter NarK
VFQNEPKLPPSETRALQKVTRTKKGFRERFIAPIKRLCRNKNFIILCNSYGLNIGVLNAMATLLNQIFLLHFEVSRQIANATTDRKFKRTFMKLHVKPSNGRIFIYIRFRMARKMRAESV